MLENIRISLKSIVSHKMRSFLTMLGIIIGIASIIAIVSIIQGSTNQLKENLVGSATNNVKIEIYADNSPYDPQYNSISLPIGAGVLTDTMRTSITELDTVNDVTAIYKREYTDSVYRGNTSLTGAFVYGVEQNYFSVVQKTVSKGRGFTQRDYEQNNKVVILDEVSSVSLFESDDPIGKTIEISGEPFVVVGVVRDKTKFEPVINSIDDYYMYQSDQNGYLYIPSKCWPVIYGYDEAQTVIVDAIDKDSMSKAGKDTSEILNSELSMYTSSMSTTVEYKATDTSEIAENIQALQGTMSLLLIFIAGISLLVGGIGVMNIMLVSVTERTREIGLKKALGAKKRVIRSQFLTEAVALTAIGGILGVLAGIGAAYLISSFMEIPVGINVLSIIVSVAFSMVVGVVFGLLPSVKASNLNPIDALRYE